MFVFTLIFVLPLLTSSRYHRFQYKPLNTQCHCVPPYLCGDDEVAVNGKGLLDPRTDNRRCANPSDYCCSNPKPLNTHPLKKHPRCGYPIDRIESRIISGAATASGELPWNLQIQERAENGNIYKCGASLIHPKVAITAAHCVNPYSQHPEKIFVKAGDWNVDSLDQTIQDNDVEEILINLDYNPSSLKNDIAMLILVTSFPFGNNTGVACLATPTVKVALNTCVASGWGKDAFTGGAFPSVLKKVQVPIVPRDYCLQKLRLTRLGARYLLHKNFICAGGKKNQDSCKGDGGSPLICPLLDDRNRFVQIGVVSWGIGCGNEGVPGVYVNVMPFLEWIESEMKGRNLDTSYFKI